MSTSRYFAIVGVVLVLASVMALGVACASSAPTATPVQPQQPAQPVAPTQVTSQATATPVSGVPTATALTPTPTRTLPTATPEATGKPVYGGTIRYALARSFDNFDPAFSLEAGMVSTLYSIFNTMVHYNYDGQIVPELASSWEFSADGKVVTFHLQPGVKFQDGTALDADAVKWNYDRFLDTKSGSARRADLVPPLDKVEVVDKQTVRFTLTAPFRPFLATLSDRPGMMASPTAVQKLNSYSDRNGDFGRKPVGSGPYILKEWVPGSHFALVKNDSYWQKGVPYSEGAYLPIIADKLVQFAMLRTGEMDIMDEMVATDALLAQKISGLKLSTLAGSRFRVIMFRVSKEPWNNKALRAAFAYAQDRKILVNVLYQGLASPAYDPTGPAYGDWFDDTIKVYDYDTQKAKQKLAEAGYPNGFSYEQPCSNNTFETQWCETEQSMLANVGIKMEIRPWNSVSYFSDWGQLKHDGPIISGIFARVDPHINLKRWFHSTGSSNLSSKTGYSNPEVDKLIDEAAIVYDMAKAKQIYNKLQTTMAEDANWIYQVYEIDLYGLRSNLMNFHPRLNRNVNLREMWLAK